MNNGNHAQSCLQVSPACRVRCASPLPLIRGTSALRADGLSEIAGDLPPHAQSHRTMREIIRSRGPP